MHAGSVTVACVLGVRGLSVWGGAAVPCHRRHALQSHNQPSQPSPSRCRRPLPTPACPSTTQQVVAIMEREGVLADTITYNSLLKAAAAVGLLPEARQLYSELLEAGLAPTTFTYAALFNAAARARHTDATWLLEVRSQPACLPAKLRGRHGAGRCAGSVCLPARMHAELRRWAGQPGAARCQPPNLPHACTQVMLFPCRLLPAHSALPASRRSMRWWQQGWSPIIMSSPPSLRPPPLRPALPPSWIAYLERWHCYAGGCRCLPVLL